METKEIKLIKLCFENIEVIDVLPEHIQYLVLNKITTTIANDWYSNNAHINESAKYARFAIKQEGNIELKDSGNGNTLFERIQKFNDLVSIELIFEDNTSREIYFNWSRQFEYKNAYQSSCVTNNGYLIVCINKKHKAEEYKQYI